MDNRQDADRDRMTPRSDRYAALPDKTRLFIENLHDDDLENLSGFLALIREKKLKRFISMVEIAEAASMITRYSKWMAATVVAVFAFVASLVGIWNSIKGNH